MKKVKLEMQVSIDGFAADWDGRSNWMRWNWGEGRRSVIASTYAHLGQFLAYLLASWLLIVLFFGLAAHCKCFFHIVPFVTGYGVVAGLLLSYFGFQDFFWWYFSLSSLFFSMVLTRHLKSKDALDAFAQLKERVIASMPEGEIKQKVGRELSPKRQTTQHVVGIVVVFIVSLVLGFYVANGGF
jgi:hypothetical protein